MLKQISSGTGGFKARIQMSNKVQGAAKDDSKTVSLYHFFSLPNVSKTEAEEILSQIKIDADSTNDMTPSKLVAALDRHIIS